MDDGISTRFVHPLVHLKSLLTIYLEIRMVTARPEGKRCLVKASNGTTISRTKESNVLHTFDSKLPGGSSKMDGPTILDCIYHENDETYYVMDLLCWNGVSVNDCEALFRLHWIQTKLTECNDDPNHHPFKSIQNRFYSMRFFSDS